jgi:hypothetical protein
MSTHKEAKTEPTTIQSAPLPSQHLGKILALHSRSNRRHPSENEIQIQNPGQQITQTHPTTNHDPQRPHPFFPRVVNNTDITFSKAELDLLNKGPRYNLHTKSKHSLTNLALEAETAIRLLPSSDRDFHRKQVSNHLTKMKTQPHTLTTPAHYSEHRTLRSIKTKFNENDATITLADKGNSLVILPTQQYNQKIQNFIDSNDFPTSPTNPTQRFQKQIRNNINRNPSLIPKDHRWRFINLKPSAPTIKALIKLHKADQPIRPIVT